MSLSLNKVLLIGNLTKDPELRYTPAGTPVATLRMAINSSFKGQDGQRKEETCFVNVVVWSKQAEICNQYLKKGRAIYVEGRLIFRSWEAEGKTRSLLEVRADRVQFMSAPGGSRGEAGAAPSEDYRAEEPAAEAAAGGGDGGGDADVPF
jgi:single-strand DNA-binding protein